MSNWNLHNLETWIKDGNKDTPESRNINKLEISHQYIYDIPDELFLLESLETLILKDNYIGFAIGDLAIHNVKILK